MRESSSSATETATAAARPLALPAGRVLAAGILGILAILGAAAWVLFSNLPDANAFNERVERLFVENRDLTSEAEIKLLEILAQSGTAFSETLNSYRFVIFVLFVFATALLIAAFVFLMLLVAMNRRMSEIDRAGMRVRNLEIDRATNAVVLNDMEFRLTPANLETLAVLAEARLDDDVLSGAEIEAMITGKRPEECDEAAGAMRIKRLRDQLGNQIVSELLVRNISRKGYMLAIDRGVIRLR